MKCEDVRDLFSEYHDDETEQASEIALHIDGCPACKVEFEAYGRILADVASLEEPDVPDGFHAALVSYADGFYRGRKRHISLTSHRFVSLFGSLAAAAAAVLFVWFSGVFETYIVAQPEMIAEFAMPHAVAGDFAAPPPAEAWAVHEDFPSMRVYEFEDEVYDLFMGYFDESDAYTWHYISQEEFAALMISNYGDYVFFEPVAAYVVQSESPTRPLVAAAILFTFVGIFVGFNIHIFVKYMERKSDNAP